MPPRGKCQSCGRTAFLSAIVVKHKDDGHMECWMVCEICRAFYEQRKDEEDKA